MVRAAIARSHATTRSAISNRSRLLHGVDGRSAAARRFRDICRAYEAEAGGDVTEVERDLIRQAAGLTLRAEQLQAMIVRGESVSGALIASYMRSGQFLGLRETSKADTARDDRVEHGHRRGSYQGPHQ